MTDPASPRPTAQPLSKAVSKDRTDSPSCAHEVKLTASKSRGSVLFGRSSRASALYRATRLRACSRGGFLERPRVSCPLRTRYARCGQEDQSRCTFNQPADRARRSLSPAKSDLPKSGARHSAGIRDIISSKSLTGNCSIRSTVCDMSPLSTMANGPFLAVRFRVGAAAGGLHWCINE